MKRIIFTTGTDTGTGKTVLTALLAEFLRAKKINVAALKPLCSGGRDDAEKIFAALGEKLDLDEINPWHFRTPIAPSLAARLEGKTVKLGDVLKHVRAAQRNFDLVLVEGAGGLLSPLGENFDSRGLIVKLDAAPIIVAQNKLGAVNHVLLTLEALPKKFRARAKIVFMSPAEPDLATESNAKLLGEFLPPKRIFSLPWFGENFSVKNIKAQTRVQKALVELLNF
jgi:dethiobiotin synthetase